MHTKDNQGWIVIIYRVASRTSTSRVTIWKKTKELGALLLQQSVYILPNLPELTNALNQLKDQIQQSGGECKLLEVVSLDAIQEKEVIDGFNRLRSQEYEEVIEGCEALLYEIDKETKAGKFYFAELEEIEKDLQKLSEWFDAVIRRDFFRADLREKVSRLIKECEDKFNSFSHEVFSREENIARGKEIRIPSIQLQREVRRVKQKEKQIYTKSEMIVKLKELIGKLEDETLKVGEEPVGALPESVILELEYKSHQSGKSLQVDLEWQ